MSSISPATEVYSFSAVVTVAWLSVVEKTADGQDQILEANENEFEGNHSVFINEIFICS
jgi:hypothetical protein